MKHLLALLAALLFAGAVSAQVREFKIDEVFTSGEEYVGQQIAVSGLCSHLCKHGGKKMFLRGANGLLRIESSKQTGAFKTDAVNEPVRVTGILRETRIDETYLRNWEDRLASGVAGHDGCETEAAARGDRGSTEQQKIDNFRKRIAERAEREGKNYLSVFYVDADAYEIL